MSEREMTQRRRLKRSGGMTLVEIMVAMVILAFGLLGVAALQVRAITESSSGRHLSEASAIARNRIEQLNAFAWDNTALDTSAGAWTAGTPINPRTGGLTYTRSERVTLDAVEPATVVKSIEVRVGWNDRKRQNRFVVLSSARLREVGE
ncbi:MAG: prepilin-type N-terminal cleavage/methylation domain-containing protein [Myxococcota bacterium]